MKTIARIMAICLALSTGINANAQFATKSSDSTPTGTVVYSLPMTAITFKVDAVKEEFIAGPYAQYAKKYMGTDARTQNEVNYSLRSISMRPYLEADPSVRIPVNIKSKGAASANFLTLCSQGLIVTSDSYAGKSESWRFPSIAANDQFAGKDVESSLTEATTTLYKMVKTDKGFERVSVSQSQVVEKSAEKKAAETAATIFKLRNMRMAIVTGDTDATYSGEAMEAAVKELLRMEDEYMSLFYGVTQESIQTMNFDVVPSADNKSQMYVAFRLSDTEGLLPESNMSGRPIVLQLEADNFSAAGTPAAKSGDVVYFRVPRTVTAKVLDGENMLMQSRIPVYQLGETQSFPLSSTILK